MSSFQWQQFILKIRCFEYKKNVGYSWILANIIVIWRSYWYNQEADSSSLTFVRIFHPTCTEKTNIELLYQIYIFCNPLIFRKKSNPIIIFFSGNILNSMNILEKWAGCEKCSENIKTLSPFSLCKKTEKSHKISCIQFFLRTNFSGATRDATGGKNLNLVWNTRAS